MLVGVLAATVVPAIAAKQRAPIGIQVSFYPTSAPVTAVPGRNATGYFFVTNNGRTPVPIDVLPGNAVPGDNGQLEVTEGPDPAFPDDITYSPQHFTVAPRATVTVRVHVKVPHIPAGVYIVAFIVRPVVAGGEINVVNEINAIVTFEVPGASKASLAANWLCPSSGVTCLHVPGLPLLQLSDHGDQTLQVVDDGTSTLYSFNEITAAQSPFGEVVFAGHTSGLPNDLRNGEDLFFPGRYLDYPATWSPSFLGIGIAHLDALVSYHPTDDTLTSVVVTRTVLVVSPWWLLVAALLELLLLVSAFLRCRRVVATGGERRAPEGRSLIGRLGIVLGGLLLALLALATGWWADKGLLALIVVLALAANGVVLLPALLAAGSGRRATTRDAAPAGAAGTAASTQRRFRLFGAPAGRRSSPRVVAARRAMRVPLLLAVVGIAGSCALVVVTILSSWSAVDAGAVLSAMAVWVLITRSLARWVERGERWLSAPAG